MDVMKFQELEADHADTSYRVENSRVLIWTKHFTRFIVTNTGKEEEISDALLTIAASKKKMPSKVVTLVRLMLHTGCVSLNDFSLVRQRYYDKDMEEIVTSKVVLRETETAIPLPIIHILLAVGADCDATPKEITHEIPGKDVLRLPKNGNPNRSEKLANFTLTSRQRQQLECLMTVTFQYGKGTDKVVEEMTVIYPEDFDESQVERLAQDMSQKMTIVGDLTQDIIEDLVKKHRPIIYQRLILSEMLTATLEKADVLGHAEKNKLKAAGITYHERIEVILQCVVQKGVKTFLDFCTTLCHSDIEQSHIVTEVLELSMDYVQSQRALHE